MQRVFLQVEAVSKRLGKGRFQVVKTDLKELVPEESINLWCERGLKPFSQGTAYVKFDRSDKLYVYPLFFEC